ncbi:MAG: PriCT-2 domain-containing protein [Prevotella sp.]|nr:PriCT-2 domain-containing protein [Prevotella sp.]
MTVEMEDNTFDPMAWLSQKETKETPHLSTSQPTVCQPLSHEEELAKATAVVRELIRMGANIAEDYRDYVRLGFALANGLGSEGRDLYHMLCAHSTKYRMRDCERKWQECLRKSDGRTSIATFYHMARQAGVELRNIKH